MIKMNIGIIFYESQKDNKTDVVFDVCEKRKSLKLKIIIKKENYLNITNDIKQIIFSIIIFTVL